MVAGGRVLEAKSAWHIRNRDEDSIVLVEER